MCIDGVRNRIHERPILLRFLSIILRVLRLEVSVYYVYIINQFQTTFARGVGGGSKICYAATKILFTVCIPFLGIARPPSQFPCTLIKVFVPTMSEEYDLWFKNHVVWKPPDILEHLVFWLELYNHFKATRYKWCGKKLGDVSSWETNKIRHLV